MSWKEVAEYCAETYGAMVDFEERFFICPECEEPIYEDDWKEDWQLSMGLCPICEEVLVDVGDICGGYIDE